MAQGQAARPLIDSDRIEGTPVYSRDGRRVDTIRRVIIDKASGRIVYVVMTLVESFGLGDVTYVIPWTRLSYDKNDGGYHSDITEADLRNALPVAHEDADWGRSRSRGSVFQHSARLANDMSGRSRATFCARAVGPCQASRRLRLQRGLLGSAEMPPWTMALMPACRRIFRDRTKPPRHTSPSSPCRRSSWSRLAGRAPGRHPRTGSPSRSNPRGARR